MTPAVGSLRVEAGALAEVSGATTFATFFATEQARLFRALVGITGNRAEAEEIVQDAFLKVWQDWDRIAAMDEPVGYLHRTAVNLSRKRIRRASMAVRRAVHLVPDVPPQAPHLVDERDRVRRVLATLPRREREAVVLTGYLGYTAVDAGQVMGITASTVRVLTTRARAALRTTEEAGS